MSDSHLSSVKIGVISFSDGRKRVHDALAADIQHQQEALASMVERTGAVAVRAGEICWTPRMAVSEAKRLLAEDVAAVMFNVSVFCFPNLGALAAVVAQRPVALCSPAQPGLPGMGGMLALGGALQQIGTIPHERIWGPYDDPQTAGRIERFIRAAGARHRLRGQVYGQIGGRSIGMMTGTSSPPAEWLRIFGVDIDHVDQSEILRRAALVSDARRDQIVRWLEAHLRSVQYAAGSKLTRDSLKQQAACAAAVKELVAEKQFDFIGIKCHYDLSEYYYTQCLSAAFLPSCVDWDGTRAPVACACEADADGALTMQLLQLISGKPALFLDLRHYDTATRTWTLCNCGGQSIHYAQRAEPEIGNLAQVDLVPVIPKYGGAGCHVRYIASPGELTFCRLTHDPSAPRLTVVRGRSIAAGPERLEASCPSWPHAFAELDVNPQTLLSRLHANHIHAVEGDWADTLELFARLVGIEYELLSNE